MHHEAPWVILTPYLLGAHAKYIVMAETEVTPLRPQVHTWVRLAVLVIVEFCSCRAQFKLLIHGSQSYLSKLLFLPTYVRRGSSDEASASFPNG